MVGGETRIGIFASEMIPRGTEVTYNYQFESFGEMRHKVMSVSRMPVMSVSRMPLMSVPPLQCLCGAKNCSGFLGKRPKTAKELAAEEAELAARYVNRQ